MGWMPDPPAAPNYGQIAQQQGQANKDAAIAQGKINNPNVITPYGSQTVEFGMPVLDKNAYDQAWADWNKKQKDHIAKYGVPIPEAAYSRPDVGGPPVKGNFMVGGDQPTIRQTLSPDQQQILDKSNQVKIGMSDLANQGVGLAQGVLGKSLDFNSLPGRPGSAEDTRTKVYDAMMSRVNEDTDRRKGLKNSELLASGIPTGSKAYQDAMALEERNRTDASTQALLASGQEASRDFQMDSARRREALGELLTERQTPINEITALMSGSQVSNPFSVPGYAQNAQVAPAPIFSAGQAQADWGADMYNAKAAQQGNLYNGLFSLGGSAIQGAGSAGGVAALFSDRRLKSNITRINEHPLGIGWYAYDIFGRHETGVMADEVLAVKPDAVRVHPSGYLMVDYEQIGRVHTA